MRLFNHLIFVILGMFLTGCTNVAMTGVSAVYNRHGIQKNIHDHYLTMQAFKALKVKSDDFNNANIAIATFHDEMLLAGQAPYAWQKEKAAEIVRRIPGTRVVYNQIQIGSPSSSLTRLSDAWITSKIKTKLIASEDIESQEVKVVTENGIVYLMGTLLPKDADVIVDIARTTSGVKSVVKIFSYINITKKPFQNVPDGQSA